MDNKLFRFILAGLAIVVIISAVARLFIGPQLPKSDYNLWQGIRPGYSSVEDLNKQFGTPATEQKIEGGSVFEYQSDFPAIPHQVVADQNQVVLFVKEFVPLEEGVFLAQYSQNLGGVDLVLRDQASSDALRAHVYLEKGLVLLAHQQNGLIEQRWYFVPTTREIFLSSWGRSLTSEEYREQLPLP